MPVQESDYVSDKWREKKEAAFKILQLSIIVDCFTMDGSLIYLQQHSKPPYFQKLSVSFT